MPRSRWFALVIAALLCVLGGANRGRVPAHEHEGSRTADEPAMRSGRSSVELVRRIALERPACVSDDARSVAYDDIVATVRAVLDADLDVPWIADEPGYPSATPRGPPRRSPLV